jgi:hypothetical protein
MGFSLFRNDEHFKAVTKFIRLDRIENEFYRYYLKAVLNMRI